MKLQIRGWVVHAKTKEMLAAKHIFGEASDTIMFCESLTAAQAAARQWEHESPDERPILASATLTIDLPRKKAQ